MSRVFITGSTDGLGLGAARLLVDEGHDVVGHARNQARADDLRAAVPGIADVAVGDLSGAAETRAVADQVNAVEPGWVATKMGGPGAPDDLALGPVTQAWLAVSDDPAATVSGQYFYHQRARAVNPAARSPEFQDELTEALAKLTGVTLPPA